VGGMIGLFLLTNQTEPTPTGDKSKIIRDSSHKQGSGPVQLVEFGDYQCPACGAAHPNVKRIMQEYNGKVTFYFRNFPLSMHQNAQAAAQAAEAAGNQGKFWEMHDKLYEAQKEWEKQPSPTDAFIGYAKTLSLDEAAFKKALDEKKFQTIIDQDFADGTALSVQATPTFFVNGKQITGGFSYESLRDAIEAGLKESGGANASPAASPAASATPAP
jgi:protein-disulfide isomerase